MLTIHAANAQAEASGVADPAAAPPKKIQYRADGEGKNADGAGKYSMPSP